MTTQDQINALEIKIQTLRSELSTFANEQRRAMIAEMVVEKNKLWEQMRREKAANRKSHGRRLTDPRDM